MKIEKRILSSFLKVFVLLVLMASCSTDDDSGSSNESFNNASFETNSNPTSFIEGDGKVTLSVSGSYNDGNITSVTRGFVYGTSTNPTVKSENNTVNAIGAGNEAKGKIEGLDQNTVYYIRGFIKSDMDDYFYGNEVKITTAKQGGEKSIKMSINPPTDAGIGIRNAFYLVTIEEMTGEAPIEVGVQYSTQSDFTDFKTFSSQDEIVLGGHGINALFLNPSTTYYFRSYAKYKDDSVTVGEDNSKITTKNMNIGDFYPLEVSNFAEGAASKYIVFKVDQDKRTALLVRTSDVAGIGGWKKEDTELGLEVRNPTVEEIKKIKERAIASIQEENDIALLLFRIRFRNFQDIAIWTSEEQNTEKAFTYNPVTEEKTAVDKTNQTLKTRFVGEIKF